MRGRTRRTAITQSFILTITMLCLATDCYAQAGVIDWGIYYGADTTKWQYSRVDVYEEGGEAEDAVKIVNRYREFTQEYVFNRQETLINLTAIRSQLNNTTCLALCGHGSSIGEVALEFHGSYEDEHGILHDAQDLADSSAVAQGIPSSYYEVLLTPDGPLGIATDGYNIALNENGIKFWLLSGVTWGEQMIYIADYCHSSQSLNSFQNGSQHYVGIGYSDEIDPYVSNTALKKVFARLGCEKEFFRYRQYVDEAIDNVHNLMVISGNELHLRLNRYLGCKVLSTDFLDVGISNNDIFWVVNSDYDDICYTVEGASIFNGKYETVVVVEPIQYNRDNWGEHYSAKLTSGYNYYRVVAETRCRGKIQSAIIARNNHEPVNDKYKNPEYWKRKEPTPVTNSGITNVAPFSCSESSGADVLVCAYQYDMVVPVASALEYYEGLDVWYITSSGGQLLPVEICNAYNHVINVNQHVNNPLWPRYPVDPGPLLVLVGPYGQLDQCIPGIEINDYFDACHMSGICFSDYLYTDTNNDNIPNGPVTRIPAYDTNEIQTMVDNSINHNNETTIAQYPKIMMLCDDDVHNYHDTLLGVSEAYRSINHIPMQILRSSGYSLPAEKADAVVADINSGIVELFGYGDDNEPHMWLDFIYSSSFPFEELTADQTFIGWMPVCWSTYAFAWDSATYYDNIVRPLMLPSNPAQRTRMASLVGHTMGGWDVHHELFVSYLIEERTQAVPGETDVATIAFNSARRMATDYPELKTHALCVSVLGSYTKIPTLDLVSVRNEENDVKDLSIAAYGTQRPIIRYSVPISGRIEVCIYDIRGQLVEKLHSGHTESGTYTTVWDGKDLRGRRMASGVYLCSINTNDHIVSEKLTLVR